MSVTWRGTTYIQPQAATYTDTTGLATLGLAASGVLAIIGTAEGGTPNAATKYTSPAEARNDFRGGNLLVAMEAAWAEGARTIYATRVGATSGTAAAQPCQQARYELTSSSTPVMRLTAIDYGDWTNNIKFKIESGTTSGKKITLQYYNSSTGVTTTETQDNLADCNALCGWVSNNSSLCSGTVLSSYGSNEPDNVGYTNLADGGDGDSPTTANWTTAIALYDNEDVDIVHVASSSSTIHGLVSTHCTTTATDKKERIGVVGGALSESVGSWDTDGSTIERAYSLNSDRMVLVAPGTTSGGTAYAPYVTAARVAGALAAVDVATPLTHRKLSCTAIESKYTSSNKDDLITYGVCGIEQVTSGRRIIRGITTAQNISSTTEHPFKEISTRRIADYVNKTIRDNLEATYVGKKGVEGIESSIASTTTSLLVKLKEQQIIVGFKDVVVSQDSTDATVYYVTYKIAPVQPINYVLIETKLSNTL